jgi:hypothetical protein
MESSQGTAPRGRMKIGKLLQGLSLCLWRPGAVLVLMVIVREELKLGASHSHIGKGVCHIL